MAKICVMTDSTADLPREIAESYQITIIPLSVIFGSEAYKDGVEISQQEFYRRLVQDTILPRTSQPSPLDFQLAYAKAAADGADQVIVLTLSSALSGTYQSAMLAKHESTIPVEVIDSQTASLALGWLAITAARAASEGSTVQQVVELVETMKKRASLLFVVDTLEYLQRNGRIGKASALLGSLLNVKPILTLEQGVVTPLEKIRGSARALERMVDIVQTRHGGDNQLYIGVMHAAAPSVAERLANQLRVSLHPQNLIISELGSVIGTHVGPNAVGITVLPW